MVDRAVADARILHRLHDLEDRHGILLRLAVEFDVGDVAAARDGVEGGFEADLLRDGHRFAHVDVERVDVVVAVGDARDRAVALAVHACEAAAQPLGRGRQHRVVEAVLGLVFVHDAVDRQHGVVERLPCHFRAGVAFAEDGRHRVVAADEADAQRPVLQHVAHLLVGLQRAAALPDVVRHHEGELPREGRALELVAFIELFGDHRGGLADRFEEDRARLLADRVLVAVGDQLRGLAHRLDGQTGHVHRGEREVAAAPRGLFAVQVLEDARAAAHRGHLVAEPVGILGAPLLVAVEGGVEEHEVGEERHRGGAARLDEQVEVRGLELQFARQRLVELLHGQLVIALRPRDALLDLEDLDREHRHLAVAQPFDRCREQLADHHAPLGRAVRAVVDRAEDHLIAAARVHRVEVVDEALHRLMGLLARGVVGLPPDAADVLVGDLHARVAERGEEGAHRVVAGFDRRDVFGDEPLHRCAVGARHSAQVAEEERHVGDVLAEGLQHARGHETVEGRDRLAAVLLVLVGLEDDRGQRGVALDRLRRTHRTVLGREAAPVDIGQIVLDAGRGLRGVVVEVVDVDVAVAVGAAVPHADEVFQRVILRDLRGEGHHLSGRRMRRHVGVREVDVVLLHRDDAVHHLLDRRAAVAFDVAPLAVDDIALGDRGVVPHEPLLDHVLNRLDRDFGAGDGRCHVCGDAADRLARIVDAARAIGLRDGPFDLLQRECLPLPVAFDDGNSCVVHVFRIKCLRPQSSAPIAVGRIVSSGASVGMARTALGRAVGSDVRTAMTAGRTDRNANVCDR